MVALVATRRGAYLSADGLAYVGTARSLVAGDGYVATPGSPPVGNFPPLFSLVLAAVGALGPDPLTVTRYLNPALYGITVLATGLATLRLTASTTLAVAAQLLVLGGTDFLAYHSSALSEPLFLLLAVAALAALARFAATGRRRWLPVAALLVGEGSLFWTFDFKKAWNSRGI